MPEIVQITPSVPPHSPLDWLFETCLPYWADNGVNKDCQSFVESLDATGRPQLDVPTRLRVQARQIYSFAHAYHLTGNNRWADLATMGFRFLTRFGWADDHGGWIHKLTPDGTVLDTRRDAYDHAFVLFALAWYGKAVDKSAAMPWIDKTHAFLDQAMRADNGGFVEERLADGDRLAPGTTLPRRQNPHMHLLEAFLALHDLTSDPAMLVKADQMITLFTQHFYDAETQSLTEYFDQNWQQTTGEPGQLREPGHHFEWVWLLNEYNTKAETPIPVTYATGLFNSAETHGVRASGDHRIAIDIMNAQGAALDAGARLWPQTEMIKAGLVHTDRERAIPAAQDALASLFRHYLDQQTGIWCDRLDADDRPVSSTIPASSLYHIMMAFTEWERLTR